MELKVEKLDEIGEGHQVTTKKSSKIYSHFKERENGRTIYSKLHILKRQSIASEKLSQRGPGKG